MGCLHDSQEYVIETQKDKALDAEEEKIQQELVEASKDFGFEGKLYIIGLPGYANARCQYASTSELQKSTSPGMILYAKGEEDVKKAIAVCKKRGMALCVRTGGHQYCGYSSTTPNNMQIDLSKTFPKYEYNAETNTLVCCVCDIYWLNLINLSSTGMRRESRAGRLGAAESPKQHFPTHGRLLERAFGRSRAHGRVGNAVSLQWHIG